MSLPTAAPDRMLKHRRSIDVQVYARGHGLWEVDAEIRDTKTHDIELAGVTRRAGEPIHHMLLRLIVDEQFNVLEAGSETLGMPYPQACATHGDTYRQLAGLNLMRGFRRGVKERLGGVRGCTHLTELTQVLPTAVIQAFAGEVSGALSGSDERPLSIGGCHALREDGEVVKLHHPRWYRAPAPVPPETDET